jgi:hypothetical protein
MIVDMSTVVAGDSPHHLVASDLKMGERARVRFPDDGWSELFTVTCPFNATTYHIGEFSSIEVLFDNGDTASLVWDALVEYAVDRLSVLQKEVDS